MGQKTVHTTLTYFINTLKPEMMRKRPGFWRNDATILHDNARPNTARLTRDVINKSAWETLPNSRYSPELAPSDFYLFGQLKKALHGRKFYDDDEVKENVLNWLQH